MFCFALGTLLLANCNRPPIEAPTGTFYGTLPCADCPGIRYELTLNDDETYVERSEYLERSVVRVDSGTYHVQQDTVIQMLGPSGNEVNRWAVTNGNLLMLDQSGAPVTGGLAKQYVLSPEKPDESAAKPQSNVDFKATGNEPFWVLEIDFDQRMRFKDLNGLELITPVPTATYPQDDVTEWKATTEQGELLVTVTQKKCQDTMSDERSGYQVQVQASTDTTEAYAYAGCGRYLGDYQVNGKWLLSRLNGQPVDEGAEAPYLALQLAENRAGGFGGCNRFTGSMALKDSALEFGALAATKMACPTLSNESAFLRALSEQSLSFRIDGQQLWLSSDSVELVLRAAE